MLAFQIGELYVANPDPNEPQLLRHPLREVQLAYAHVEPIVVDDGLRGVPPCSPSALSRAAASLSHCIAVRVEVLAVRRLQAVEP